MKYTVHTVDVRGYEMLQVLLFLVLRNIDFHFHSRLKHLKWLLDHEIDQLGLDLTFSIETDAFGCTKERELKPGGAKIVVNDRNKVHTHTSVH